MIHSGSRSLGAAVAKECNKIARELNERYFSSVPSEWSLYFLPVDDEVGNEYTLWVRFACGFAKRNRLEMLRVTKDIVKDKAEKFVSDFEVEFTDEIDVHYNYAAIENHSSKNVWVHRKGAITRTLFEGLGNKDSFNSTSGQGAR